MLAYAPAAVTFLVFCVGVLRDRRRFSNAVLLGLSLVFALAAWCFTLVREDTLAGRDVAVAGVVVGALCVLVPVPFLLANGVTMVRREGRGPANLLSLLAGLGLLALAALLVTAFVLHARTLLVLAGTITAIAGYFGFLFACMLAYAFLYGHVRVRRRTDYVVVLGAGLLGGERVSPLLAARLDRGLSAHRKLTKRGREPLLLLSGGKGGDEALPEAEAMARYVREKGFPERLLVREEHSATTGENLRNSHALMAKARPGYRCVVVTSNYHVFRTAVTARRVGVRGHVVGAPTAPYFWPSATIREFVALLVDYRRTNAALCLLLVLGGALVWWLSR
ncbi:MULTISPECIES: YdcF family protein [unclassified Streptomyces]|uniref:YdcF family protein n=1 Tax=unclassified Streptomyces TaxID=2593676 RepID=UPI001012D8B0|nr:YdcF family protein [Streptomyces sp. GZWMJZ-114]